MNDWKERYFQEKVENLKSFLGNPNAKPKNFNTALDQVINLGYDSSMLNGLLESFRLCVTQPFHNTANINRGKIARKIWSFIEKDYFQASDEIISEKQRIDDYSIAINIPCLTVAKKMGENEKFKTAIYKLERDCEDKPEKKRLLRAVVFASDQGPVIDNFIAAMQDNILLKELIDELKSDQINKGKVYSLGKMELLEKLLISEKPSSYAVTQKLLVNGKRKRYEPVADFSSESCYYFDVQKETSAVFSNGSTEQEDINSYAKVDFWQQDVNVEIDYSSINYEEVAKLLDSIIQDEAASVQPQ
jgi:hypothetical protein